MNTIDTIFTIIGLLATIIFALLVLGFIKGNLGLKITNPETKEEKKFGNYKDEP